MASWEELLENVDPEFLKRPKRSTYDDISERIGQTDDGYFAAIKGNQENYLANKAKREALDASEAQRDHKSLLHTAGQDMGEQVSAPDYGEMVTMARPDLAPKPKSKAQKLREIAVGRPAMPSDELGERTVDKALDSLKVKGEDSGLPPEVVEFAKKRKAAELEGQKNQAKDPDADLIKELARQRAMDREEVGWRNFERLMQDGSDQALASGISGKNPYPILQRRELESPVSRSQAMREDSDFVSKVRANRTAEQEKAQLKAEQAKLKDPNSQESIIAREAAKAILPPDLHPIADKMSKLQLDGLFKDSSDKIKMKFETDQLKIKQDFEMGESDKNRKFQAGQKALDRQTQLEAAGIRATKGGKGGGSASDIPGLKKTSDIPVRDVDRSKLMAKVSSTKTVLGLLDQLEALKDESGSEAVGSLFNSEASTKMDAIRAELTGAIKEAEQLGTLDRGVTELVAQMLPSVGTLSDKARNMTQTLKQKMRMDVKNSANSLGYDVDENYLTSDPYGKKGSHGKIKNQADMDALNWAKSNPEDPRAAQILKRLGVG